MFKTRKVKPKATDIANLEDVEVGSEEFRYLYETLQRVFADQARRQNIVLFDQLAKSERTTTALSEEARTMLATTPRGR
jgi:hypothetical protein